ncbi:MAG: MBL fold metallo-hydrolase, partial [Myxococcota bacterium]
HRLETEADIGRFIDSQLPFDVRGSFGGNTSCVEIIGADEHVICDAGTGLRDLGQSIVSSGSTCGVFNIFISHPHWDHIQGFPFFMPAFAAGHRINIYGCHENLKGIFEMQQSGPMFPVPLAAMKAKISFIRLEPGRVYDLAGMTVKAARQNHPGDSYGYRFDFLGKRVVYSTDAEHFGDALEEGYYFNDFSKGADLLVYDAQYSLADAIVYKEHWGHSSNVVGVEQAVKAGVKRLCMYHGEHTRGDAEIEKMLQDTREYLKTFAPDSPLEIVQAYDGLMVEI